MVPNSVLQLDLIQARVSSIPDGWSLCKVTDALHIRNNLRKPISQEVRNTMKGIYPYYGPTKIQGYISEYEQDGIYALIGEDGDHFLKYSKMAQTQYVSGKCTVNNHAHILESSDICDSRWFYNYFKHRDITNFLSRQGAGRFKLNKATLEKLPMLIPPLLEQRKIAKILSTWDKAITTTEKLIVTSQKQKKALMQQLLTGKKRLLRSPEKEGETGMVFEGDWEEVTLNQCLSMMKSGLSRKLESENVGIAVMRSNNIGERYTSDDDLKYWYLNDPQGAKVENYILDNGDILVNFINSLSQIGKTCVYKKKNTLDAIYTTNILRLKADESIITSDFLFYLTKTKHYKNSVQSITKPAVNQASFTTKEFGRIKFVIPTLEEQQKIASVLTAADKEIELLDAKLSHFKQEKKALMQQLLTGKKRVKLDKSEAA